MGDIKDIEAAQSIKIVGAEVDGKEQTPVRSFPWGEIRSADIVTKAIDGTLNFSAGTPTEVKVGVSRMSDRKVVFFIPSAKGKYGFSAGSQNIPVFKNQPVTIHLSEDQGVWFNFNSGTHDLFVMEGSGEN